MKFPKVIIRVFFFNITALKFFSLKRISRISTSSSTPYRNTPGIGLSEYL